MKSKLILFFLMLSGISHAQFKIDFLDLSLQDAISKSASVGKPVFFMGFASWCPHCKKMKETIFTDSAVADFYNSHYVCVEQDMEQGEGPELAQKYSVHSYPTFVFLNGTGQRIFQSVGELDSATFMTIGKAVLNPQKQLPYLQQQFEQNVGDTAKAIPYLQALNRGQLPTQEIAQRFFATKTEKQMLNYECWRVLNLGVSDISSPEFKFIVDHQKDYGEIISPQRVQRKIFRTIAYNIQPLADKNDTAQYFALRKVAASFHNSQVDSLIFNLDLQLFEVNNQWSSYQQTAMQGTQRFEWNDYAQLQHISDMFLKSTTDAGALSAAATWAKRSSDLQPQYANLLLCAKLLEKTGDKTGAQAAAQKAIDLAAKTNSNHAEADLLIKRVSQ